MQPVTQARKYLLLLNEGAMSKKIPHSRLRYNLSGVRGNTDFSREFHKVLTPWIVNI